MKSKQLAVAVLGIVASQASAAEGQTGATPFTFTVTRNSTVGTSTIAWAVEHTDTSAADAKLYEAIKLNGAPPLSTGEASAVIKAIGKCEVTNVDLGADEVAPELAFAGEEQRLLLCLLDALLSLLWKLLLLLLLLLKLLAE